MKVNFLILMPLSDFDLFIINDIVSFKYTIDEKILVLKMIISLFCKDF